MVASTISTLPKLCPELQTIHLSYPQRDPMVTAAVSGMLLATNRNTLRKLRVDSPLTKEASEVIFKLSDLWTLSVVIERGISLPSASLPNLIKLKISCEDEGNWSQLFHGAELGKLESVSFSPQSKGIGDILGAFKRSALSSSVQNTLSKFHVSASCSWNPNYLSLLPFTQLVDLFIGFTCNRSCSSSVDDDIIIDLSRAMPKLQALKLGDEPCRQPTTGVTVKGLTALALHCPYLRCLCIHFQVASLIAAPASPGISCNAGPTDSRSDCDLRELVVGQMLVPEESVVMVAQTLLHIFPRIEQFGKKWGKVMNTIRLSKRSVDYSSKHLLHHTL